MNTPLKLVLLVCVRYVFVALGTFLMTRAGMTKEEYDKFVSPEMMLGIVTALAVLCVGVYTRLRAKTRERIALALPEGSTEANVEAHLEKQTTKAVLTTNPA